MNAYCAISTCERETRDGRELCDLHEKRKQRGGDMHAPVQERLNPEQRFFEALERYNDVSSEDDGAYLHERKRLLAAVANFSNNAMSAIVKQALAEARARGIRLGSPPKLDYANIHGLVALWGGVSRAARELGVSRRTVQRALRRAATETGFVSQGGSPQHGQD